MDRRLENIAQRVHEKHCLPVPEAEKFTRLYDMLDYNDVPTFCGFPLQHSIDDAAAKVFQLFATYRASDEWQRVFDRMLIENITLVEAI